MTLEAKRCLISLRLSCHLGSSMKTERFNAAGRMVTKALCKSPWGAGLVKTDIGSDDRLAQHNLQIPAHASNRIMPPYLYLRDLDSHQVTLMLY
eukprot:754464-Pelagomonas_calceolata.AAC.2